MDGEIGNMKPQSKEQSLTSVQHANVLPSVPEALKILDRLRTEVRTAPSFEVINSVSDAAAGLQRMFTSVKPVADSAGRTWTDAEARLGEELAKLPKAKGTRGQISERADDGTIKPGGTHLEPPGEDAPSLSDLSVSRKRSVRAQKLAELGEKERNRFADELAKDGKAVTPDAILRRQRAEDKTEAKHNLAEPRFSADGPFDCVVVDPPWQMAKIDRDVRPNQSTSIIQP